MECAIVQQDVVNVVLDGLSKIPAVHAQVKK